MYTDVLPGMKGVSLKFLFSAPIVLLVYYFCLCQAAEAISASAVTVVLFFYVSVAMILVLAMKSTAASAIMLLVKEQTAPFLQLLSLVFRPLSTGVPFQEVLLADALCSLSKIFKDIGIFMVTFYANISYTPPVESHDGAMLLVAALATLPFALRTRQCYIQLLTVSDWGAGIPVCINIIKYVSSFFPIWLACAISLGVHHRQMHTLMIVFATINSCISYGWDIAMDWGLVSLRRSSSNSSGTGIKRIGGLLFYFRPRLLLPAYFHMGAAVINLFLRFSWTATMVPALASLDSPTLVLIVEVAEVLRRSMWNIFRVEWEIISSQDKATVSASSSAEDGADKSLLK